MPFPFFLFTDLQVFPFTPYPFPFSFFPFPFSLSPFPLFPFRRYFACLTTTASCSVWRAP